MVEHRATQTDANSKSLTFKMQHQIGAWFFKLGSLMN